MMSQGHYNALTFDALRVIASGGNYGTMPITCPFILNDSQKQQIENTVPKGQTVNFTESSGSTTITIQ